MMCVIFIKERCIQLLAVVDQWTIKHEVIWTNVPSHFTSSQD